MDDKTCDNSQHTLLQYMLLTLSSLSFSLLAIKYVDGKTSEQNWVHGMLEESQFAQMGVPVLPSLSMFVL